MSALCLIPCTYARQCRVTISPCPVDQDLCGSRRCSPAQYSVPLSQATSTGNRSRLTRSIPSSDGGAPVEQVVEPELNQLHAAIAAREGITREHRDCRRRHREAPAPHAQVVVLRLDRPIWRDGPFKTGSRDPARERVGAGVTEGLAGRYIPYLNPVGANPTSAGLAINEKAISGKSNPSSNR